MSQCFIQGQENELLDFISKKKYTQFIFLVDANTNGFCLHVLFKLFPSWRNTHRIIIPQGEQHKTLEIASLIWDQLEELQCQKSTLLINVGGGMITDIGGFAASVYKRGIDTLNIPTTLLAMTDAAYGGKTGIDYHNIKNHLGTFHHPIALYIHPLFLQSLDNRILFSGIAETIKHALLDAGDWWHKMQDYTLENFLSVDTIMQSLQIKIAIVEQDEKDVSIRQTLNVGHSIGHAIESYALQTNNPLLHGEAIMLGMMYEAKISEQLLGLNGRVYHQLQKLQKRFFLFLHAQYKYSELLPFLLHDKKNNDGIRMSLIQAPGKCLTNILVTPNLLQDILP